MAESKFTDPNEGFFTGLREELRAHAATPKTALEKRRERDRLRTVLQQPIVMMGFCLAEDNMHAPNEQIYLPNYYAAIRSVAGFLKNLAP